VRDAQNRHNVPAARRPKPGKSTADPRRKANTRNERANNIARLRRGAAPRPKVPTAAVRDKRPAPVHKPRPVKTSSYPTVMLWGLILVLLFLYLGGYIFTYLTAPQVAETRIELGSVEQPKVYDGLIVRDEVLYHSNAEGVVVFSLNDLEQVPRGGEIYSVQDAARVASIEAELKKIDTAIIDRQSERAGLSIHDEEIRESNALIKNTVDTLSFRASGAELSKMYEMADKVRQGLDARNRKLLSENRGSLKSFMEEREISTTLLAGAKQNAYAAQSGIVSYITDGQEEILTPGALGTITKEQTKMQVDYAALSYPKEVEAGKVVCKIVQSSTWYIASYVDTAAAADWNVNSIRTLYIDVDGVLQPLEVRIDRMEKANESETYVVFRCTRSMLDYMNSRNLQFRLEKGVMEGLKIPNSAIVDKTILKVPLECVMQDAAGRNIVIRRANGLDEPIPITISATNDTTVDVVQDFNNLRFGDTLVTKAAEGDTSGVRVIDMLDNVKGVYVTNTGSTVFKRINLEGRTMSNAAYTVLDPDLNTAVRIYDKIVSDAKNIDERQLTRRTY